SPALQASASAAMLPIHTFLIRASLLFPLRVGAEAPISVPRDWRCARDPRRNSAGKMPQRLPTAAACVAVESSSRASTVSASDSNLGRSGHSTRGGGSRGDRASRLRRANIADAALFPVGFLAEVPGERLPPARHRLRVALHRLELLEIPRLTGAVGGRADPPALDERQLRAAILRPVEERCPRRLAVTPGASRLLIVGVERSGHVVVDDEADVLLVDAHAEGVGRHHRLHAAAHEALVILAALAPPEAAVIPRGVDAGGAQYGRYRLDLRHRRHVDDAGALGRANELR